MDHDTIAETHAVERYLLDEMSADEREQFETHFFECEACAEDVLSGSMFVANSRAVFAEDAEAKPVRAPDPVPEKRPWWTAIMRPVWGVALAGALAIFGVIRVAMPPAGVPAVVELRLDPGEKRGGADESAPYKKGDPIALRLSIEEAGAVGPHVLEIRDRNSGNEVDAVPVTLNASDTQTGKEVRFSSKKIPAGSYVAVLRATQGSERGKVVGEYPFTLTPR
jgi:hypothetical protein